MLQHHGLVARATEMSDDATTSNVVHLSLYVHRPSIEPLINPRPTEHAWDLKKNVDDYTANHLTTASHR